MNFQKRCFQFEAAMHIRIAATLLTRKQKRTTLTCCGCVFWMYNVRARFVSDTAPAKGSKMKLKHKLAVDAFGLEGECANAEDESLCPACYKASSGAMVQCDRCDKWCHCACVVRYTKNYNV